MNLQNRLVKVGFKKTRVMSRENIYTYNSGPVEIKALFRNNSISIKMLDQLTNIERIIFRVSDIKNIKSFKDVLDSFPVKIKREIKLNNILRSH